LANEPLQYISHFRDEGKLYINWNKLTYDTTSNNMGHIYDGMFYYGAYRKDREPMFKKYMDHKLYDVIVSTSSKGESKFKKMKGVRKTYGPISHSQISLFQWTIYMEDNANINLKHSPANRFYECLSAGVAMLFDKNAEKTFEREGMDISKYIVSNAEEALKHSCSWKEIAKEQAELYGRDYRNELRDEIKYTLMVS